MPQNPTSTNVDEQQQEQQTTPADPNRLVTLAQALNPIRVTMPLFHAAKWAFHGTTQGTRMVTGRLPTNQLRVVPQQHLAICLIHGTADQSSGCQRLAELLQERLGTFAQVITPDFYNCPTGSFIRDFAQNLLQQCQAAQIKDLVLIGHSRGGLVAAYLTTYLAAAAGITVHLLECVAAPFQGSEWANRADAGHQLLRKIPLADKVLPQQLYLREMARGNDELLKLCADFNAIIEQGLPAHFHGSTGDWIVNWRHTHPHGELPEDVNQLPPNFHMPQTNHCHLSLMTSSEMADGIASRIKGLAKYQELAKLDAAQCQAMSHNLARFSW